MARLYDTRPLLANVDTERAADIFRLAQMGDPKAGLLWNDLIRDNKPLARLAQSYAEKCASKSERARREVDKVIVKGSKAKTVCMGCYKRLKPKHQMCPACGRANPIFIAKEPAGMASKAKQRDKKRRNRAQKYGYENAKAVEKAAWSAAAGRPVESRGEDPAPDPSAGQLLATQFGAAEAWSRVDAYPDDPERIMPTRLGNALLERQVDTHFSPHPDAEIILFRTGTRTRTRRPVTSSDSRPTTARTRGPAG